jgi:predicted RNase H-like nuclease
MIASADGCKGGWVVAIADGWPCKESPRLLICKNFAEVVSETKSCSATVVDMPIGLPAGPPADEGHRQCDKDAREKLGRHGWNRVFLVPPRRTLEAQSLVEFQSSHASLLNCGAGLPVWGIVSKLKEVDQAMTPALQDRIYEFHPELVWWRLSGHTLSSKHGAAGIIERLEILREMIPTLDRLHEWDGAKSLGHAKIDDLLDALVGLPVAGGIASTPQTSWRLPEKEPKRDERGLRMEMWY